MANITEIDKNFKNESAYRPDMKLYNVKEEPFKLYGFCETEDKAFKRIPTELAEKLGQGVMYNYAHTSGGRVRFKTDSEYIILKTKMSSFVVIPHMPVTGTSSFDLYADGEYVKTLHTPLTYDGFDAVFELKDGFEAIATFEDKKMRDIIINFPPYNVVDELYIGISESAQLLEGNEYKHKKPIVFYGSSITQGACASRPGNTYISLLSRWFDTDILGLGFSGNAVGGETIANYIADLDMNIFVYDYDFNAPNAEHLEKTHEEMFKIIREKNPDLPIIMASRVNAVSEENKERFKIIEKTYKNAVENGDKNVYLINGMDVLTSIDKEMFTVDGCHPNDFGFYCMAKAFGDVIKTILE